MALLGLITLLSPHEGPTVLSIANMDYIVSALPALSQGYHAQHDLRACLKRQPLRQRGTKASLGTLEICRINFVLIKLLKK